MGGMTDERSWPLCGYAPGHYMCTCVKCSSEYTGDKRAMECLDCAAQSANHLMASARTQLRDMAAVNERLCEVLEAAQLLLEVHDALGNGQSPSASRLRNAITTSHTAPPDAQTGNSARG